MRKSNFEWLRVLAMGMIITMHYMIKGAVITDISEDMRATNLILNLITMVSLCAVNVYVLISGYFLVETDFKSKRVIDLIVQVLEYSIVITIIMLLTGHVTLGELTIYDWIGYVLPIGTEEYWFITAYILMYLFSPVLATGIKAVKQDTLRFIIIALLILTSFEKTILPMHLPNDHAGYDVVWFIVLFLIAGYIRLYGIKCCENSKLIPMVIFVVSAVGSFVVYVISSTLWLSTGIETFRHFVEVTWDYNFILTLTSAIGLFYIFKNASFNETKKTADIARTLGKLTLGVYLLHEHPMIRYWWPSLISVGKVNSMKGSATALILDLASWIVAVIAVFTVGAAVEYVRQWLHKLLKIG